jgi:hypothetical protein
MVVRKPHLSSQVFAHQPIYTSDAMVFYEKCSEGYHSCCVGTQIQVLLKRQFWISMSRT